MDGQPEAKAKPAKAEEKATIAGAPRILLAEDDFEMRNLLAWSLGRKGYNIVACQDGYALMKEISLLKGLPPHEQFDIIISDIRMPGLTGLEVMESIKRFENFPPMILITGFPDQEVREQAQQLGAAAILAKPFDFDYLLTKIRQILGECPSKALQVESEVLYDLSPRKTTSPLRKNHGRLFSASERQQIALSFPLRINFPNYSGEYPIEAFIHEKAANLNNFGKRIIFCRVVISESVHHEHRAHRYYTTIILTVPGKTIVALHNSDKKPGDLYLSVQIAFEKACRQLKRYIRKHKQHKRSIQSYQ